MLEQVKNVKNQATALTCIPDSNPDPNFTRGGCGQCAQEEGGFRSFLLRRDSRATRPIQIGNARNPSAPRLLTALTSLRQDDPGMHTKLPHAPGHEHSDTPRSTEGCTILMPCNRASARADFQRLKPNTSGARVPAAAGESWAYQALLINSWAPLRYVKDN